MQGFDYFGTYDFKVFFAKIALPLSVKKVLILLDLSKML